MTSVGGRGYKKTSSLSDFLSIELPELIVETQYRNWLGRWEPTAPGEPGIFASSFEIEEEPRPFVAYRAAAAAAAAAPTAARTTSQGSVASSTAGLEELRCDPAWLETLLYPKDAASARGSHFGPRVDPTTDEEGWIYASSGKRLEVKRQGGRAAWRYGDKYRRRWWCRGLPQVDAPEASNELSGDHRSKAMGSFAEVFHEVYGSRSLAEKSMALSPISSMRRKLKDDANYKQLCARLPPWTDSETLGEFCVAALYTRAAYGFTGRTGKFDSLTSGGMIFSVQKAVFDYAEHVDDESNAHAFIDMMALPSDSVICAQWRAQGPFRPAFVAARDHEMRWIVVAVRGTLSLKDILTDVAAKQVDFLDGRAHEGFVHCADFLEERLVDVLSAELRQHPGYRIVFCGHSMGGAVGAMVAARLRKTKEWAQDCISFGIGTPGVLSASVGERLASEQAVFTAVNGQDWAPRVSLSSANELIDDLCNLSVVRSTFRMFSGSDTPEAKPPDMLNEQVPPGAILQIVRGNSREEPPRLLQAHGIDYRNSVPIFPDVEAHLPIGYVRGLFAGFQSFAKMFLRSKGISGGVAVHEPPRVEAVFAALRRIASDSGAGFQQNTNNSSAGWAALPETPDDGRELVAAWLKACR
eukprot:TRINITY_DN6774_c0_g2_i2.p1 TRINITY_DN6774_c0_g2~~TRINITY_DN6774_c0_g2_i2.p1  ORF type:complete len:639 (+),score=117.36 TRINITY_DN6774_c0_g2_i2:133-2049(+)